MYRNNNLNILIPMAGDGSRFKIAGYTFPKPLIDIYGKAMIEHVVKSLQIEANYIYIVKKEHCEKYSLEMLLGNITPSCRIIEIDKTTEGAACTTLIAKNLIDNNNQLMIANADQWISWNPDAFFRFMDNDPIIDAAALTFYNNHPKWSYVKAGPSWNINEVAEKKPISNIATVGIYWWRRGSDYVKYAEQMISKNIRTNGEFYVCPVFNEAIADRKIIVPHFVEKMRGLGTPEDLQQFLVEKLV